MNGGARRGSKKVSKGKKVQRGGAYCGQGTKRVDVNGKEMCLVVDKSGKAILDDNGKEKLVELSVHLDQNAVATKAALAQAPKTLHITGKNTSTELYESKSHVTNSDNPYADILKTPRPQSQSQSGGKRRGSKKGSKGKKAQKGGAKKSSKKGKKGSKKY